MGLLVAFEACARLQKFTAAADELSLTQSAVSRQIRALEEIVGVELFARERQTVRLTPAGEAYAAEVRQALRAISHATLRLKASPDAGTLTLAILPTMGTRWLAPLLPDFTQQNPGVTLNLVTRLEPFNMETDGVDAALHYGAPEWPRAELDFLFEETVVPACSRALKAQHGFAAPADLLGAPLLHLASRPQAWAEWFEGQGLALHADAGMAAAGPPQGAQHRSAQRAGTSVSTDQFATAMQAAAAGLGVALLPEFLFQEELARGSLVPAVDVRCRSAGRYYLACAANRAWYPPLTAFRRWIRTQAAGITAAA
ncbi:LysR family transcriptional regulator [Pseudorhodoferax sp. Leaf274]|nr:LysR family transcriptional regulator [Pseudorhodoferax sp. Leaf274]